MTQVEEEKKKIRENSVRTRPGKENFKKNSKKIQKIKQPHSDIISIQNGMRLAEKEKKKFQSRIPLLLDPGKKIPKKIAKKFEKLKNVIPALFLFKPGLDSPRKRKKKKKFSHKFRSYPTGTKIFFSLSRSISSRFGQKYCRNDIF